MTAQIRVARSNEVQEMRTMGGELFRFRPGVQVDIQYIPGAGQDALAELDRVVEQVRRDVAECP